MSPSVIDSGSDTVFENVTTSAREPMLGRVYIGFICVAGAFSTLDATSEEGFNQVNLRPQEQTNSGSLAPESLSSSPAIMELRRLSGLTWDQLARLFDVSRRSLHFWASGKPLNAVNEEHLYKLLATIHEIDRGSTRENRSLILGVLEDGTMPFDLLADGQYEHVLALLGPGRTPERPKRVALSVEAQLARRPRPPDELVGALQERIPEKITKGRVPRAARSRK
ncbi:MAG: helix-turn-helix domain-containing protein [Candidatus Tectomicrobia bacterium]|nr:helix-turn-helix domain-containing protein [Candidatus Tectomicrobia bacterium]